MASTRHTTSLSLVRTGFTLIEVLVALVLFEFGMLALAASSAVAARDLAAANLGIRAQALARNRVELLRSRACPAADDGDARAARGMREFWRVNAIGQLRVISDSVEFALPRARRAHVVYRAWTICAATPAPPLPAAPAAPAAPAVPAAPAAS